MEKRLTEQLNDGNRLIKNKGIWETLIKRERERWKRLTDQLYDRRRLKKDKWIWERVRERERMLEKILKRDWQTNCLMEEDG